MALYLWDKGGCFFGGWVGCWSQSGNFGAGPYSVKGSVGLSYHKEMSSSRKFQLLPPCSKGLGDFDTHGCLHCNFLDKVVDFGRLTHN